ncbi:PorV/PorQ family protein [bacterium]|nr:PorV/PorQ family protein [bacterium]
MTGKRITYIMLFAALTLRAGAASGKYAGAFLMNPVGSRAASIGGAFTAVADDASAVYWNPAGIAGNAVTQITGMHAERFAGMVNLDFMAASYNMPERAAFGIGFLRLGVDDIPVTRLENPGQPLGKTNLPYVSEYWQDDESALFLTYAKNQKHNFSWGVNVKILRKTMGNKSAWGLGFDGGVLYLPTPALHLGAALFDGTTTMVAWKGGSRENILPHLRLGMAYSIRLRSVHILPSVDLVNQSYEDPAALFHIGRFASDLNGGIEISVFQRLALRFGSFKKQLTAGTGLRLSGIQMDYCFLRHSDLGDSHLISISIFPNQYLSI